MGPFNVYSGPTFLGVYGNSTSYIDATIYAVNGNPNLLYQFASTIYDTSVSNNLAEVINEYPGSYPTPLAGLSQAGTTNPVTNLTATLNLPLTVAASFAANAQVTLQVTQSLTASNANFTSSLYQGSFTVTENLSQGSYPSATTSSGRYITSFSNPTSTYGLITFGSTLSSFSTYQQIPYFISGSPQGVSPVTTNYIYSSSLYSQYGDKNTTFTPQQYDKIILQDVNGLIQDLNVYSSSFNGSQLQIQTVPTINTAWVTTPSLVQKFLLLRRYNDEQNVIVTFNKPPGQTSYGFLIPDTVSPQITNNINTLQAAVQSQLLSTQTAVTSQ